MVIMGNTVALTITAAPPGENPSIPELEAAELNPPFDSSDGSKRAKRVKYAIKATGGCHCYLCGEDLDIKQVTLDHVVPRAAQKGLRNNLRVCCKSCNCFKACMPADYVRALRGFIERAGLDIELKQFTPHKLGSRLTTVHDSALAVVEA